MGILPPVYKPFSTEDMESLYGKYPIPSYSPPTYDRSRLRFLAEEQAAPGLRSLRRGMSEALGRSYENPNVMALAKREALSGYGEGLENVYAGARSAAHGLYAPEFAAKEQAGRTDYSAQLQDRYNRLAFALQFEQEKRRTEYEKELAEYEKLFGKAASPGQQGNRFSGTGSSSGTNFWDFKAKADTEWQEWSKLWAAQSAADKQGRGTVWGQPADDGQATGQLSDGSMYTVLPDGSIEITYT